MLPESAVPGSARSTLRLRKRRPQERRSGLGASRPERADGRSLDSTTPTFAEPDELVFVLRVILRIHRVRLKQTRRGVDYKPAASLEREVFSADVEVYGGAGCLGKTRDT